MVNVYDLNKSDVINNLNNWAKLSSSPCKYRKFLPT